MVKKVFFLIIIILIILLFYWLNNNSSLFQNISSDLFSVGIKNIDVDFKDVDIKKLHLDLNFEVNAVFNNFEKDYVEMTLFLSNFETKKSDIFYENNFLGYYEVITNYDTTFIIAEKKEVISYAATNSKNAIACVLDYSGSMYDRTYFQNSYNYLPINYLEQAVSSFINKKEKNDIISLIKFGSFTDKITEFESDKNVLLNALYNNSSCLGGTMLYPALKLAINDLALINDTYNKAIIAFSDGATAFSWNLTESDIIELANAKKIPIFTLGLISMAFDDRTLQALARETGGFYYKSPSLKDIENLYLSLSNNIKNSYLIKFYWSKNNIPKRYDKLNFVCRIVDNNSVLAEYKKENVYFN